MKNFKITVLAFSLLISSNAFASDRPFWTEKSTFEENGKFNIVGVGSNQATIEDARAKALISAERELQAYLATGRTVSMDTQMTYQESHEDGTVTVYRLFTIPIAKLHMLKAELAENLGKPEPVSQAVEQVCHAKPVRRPNKFNPTLTFQTFEISCDSREGAALPKIRSLVDYLSHVAYFKDPRHKKGFNCVSIDSEVACD